jgi:hypothetical protein
MEYKLKWGNATWLYALGMGLLFGLGILLLSSRILGEHFHESYYVPMLGYYVLLSIAQSHYFRTPPGPSMKGLFRQFVSIFGAVILFFVHETIMVGFIGIPQPLAMPGHFTLIVFGFFLYGFDDFMYGGRLVRWLKNDILKAIFWYVVIWILWALFFAMKGGPVEGYSLETFHEETFFRWLACIQWIIIMSLMVALTFKDAIPSLRIRNRWIEGTSLLIFSIVGGIVMGHICLGLIELLAPWGSVSNADKWHHVLYMGTYPLIPVVLMGVYTDNYSKIRNPMKRVSIRLAYLIPSVVLSYFLFHLVIASPEYIVNQISPGTLNKGIGIFGLHPWHHHFDLVFNFTVSIIPLTHHWFSGKVGFVKKIDHEWE